MRRFAEQGPGHVRSHALLAVLVCGACQGAPKTAAAPPSEPQAQAVSSATPAMTSAPEPARIPLRTGSIAPVSHETSWRLEVVGRSVDGNFEILELALPVLENAVDAPDRLALPPNVWESARVQVTSDPAALGFIQTHPSRPPMRVWLRRAPSTSLPQGVFFTPAYDGLPGHRIPFHAEKLPPVVKSVERTQNWGSAAADFFAAQPGAFYQFAASRLRTRYAKQPSRASGSGNASYHGDLARLMATFSGRRVVQAALESDRPLYLAAAHAKATIPIEKVERPSLLRHPWEEMSRTLGKNAREEPLARAAPQEFYFARVKSFARFIDLLDWVNDWGEPAADLLDAHSEDRGTLERYQDELGLEATGLARAFGPTVIDDVALVGSDPYVHEGTDITLVFRVKNKAAFDAGLAAALVKRAAGRSDLEQTSFEHEGVKVGVTRSRDGRIRRHRASVNGLELVSNSPNALKRVLATIAGHHPSLANEPDFRYLTARDAELQTDAFAYVGDEFVAAVTGPAQKVAEARRQIALAELCTPAYAALLSGWVDGKSPSSSKALQAAKWLTPGELRHADGALIHFEPGTEPSSTHGSPARLEPLIDLPAVARVTADERRAYESFARGYRDLWTERIDPIALSLNLEDTAGGRSMTADLRVLPLLRREYREWIELVGNARVAAPNLTAGARVVAAIGRDARVRALLQGFGEDFLDNRKLRFDWLGDYVVVGASNRNELSNTLLPSIQGSIERPRRSSEGEPPDIDPAALPLYAIVSLKSSLAAGLALTALRQKASEAAPGAITWGRAAPYRGNDVVQVGAHEHNEKINLYYALLPSAFVIALNRASLHEAIDQVLDHPPVAEDSPRGKLASSGQVVVELASDPSTALHRLAAAIGTAALYRNRHSSSALAEAVLRGAPEIQTSPERVRALLRAYFGVVPLTPDGRPYEYAPEGARDPVRGTDFAPTYPDFPVPGSPLQRVLATLRSARSEQSFDPEPGHTAESPRQSLHLRASITTTRDK